MIDLNADLGEGFGHWRLGDDDALLDLVTSANVACGFHAGDPSTMRRVCSAAVGRGVRIGAQVGYRDLAGFGRRDIEYDPHELADDVLFQIGALDAFARAAGDRVRYVKPHGALYNRIVHDAVQAEAVVRAVAAFASAYDETVPVLGLPGSVFLELATTAGLPTVQEAFADRAYTPQGTLVPRTAAGAVLTSPEEVAGRAVEMAVSGTVRAIDGTLLAVSAQSLCVHGDSPSAVEMAAAVRDGLRSVGVEVGAFA
ncbi:LamB/YcsF family protein [Catenulispora sp. NF23]|uniref:5-oxoprolinase subunit A n=1 Tax=Catenulispora pinistramenti TaxID=2705254 RepID=A0ABS5KKE6_9ACTN|nr:5-oxoprolinase subunit PxpA [Catenulispora pinistramenti]MBS2531354.1 LamB/YcsF family protein [Catenulispora pinistramenti]MBS2546036.1 LamB/YcsF family protein [Catenulispora pinistramenti]